MRTNPNGWAEARSGLHRWESKVTIAGVEYSEEDIFELSTKAGLFSTGSISIGGCVAKEVDLIVMPKGEIPRMAEIRLFVRPVSIGVETEWLQKGVFYIDTRSADKTTGLLTIHGYDAMLKTEQPYLDDGSAEEWPQSMATVAATIAERIGVTLDGRSVINSSFTVGYPADYTMRELLSHIAVANGGNWSITDDGKLRLVLLEDNESGIDVGCMMSDLSVSPAFDPISRVSVLLDDKTVYTSGDDSGRTMEAACPWGTQGMADALIAKLRGYVYRPFSATGAVLDPVAELGDTVVVNGTRGYLASIETTFGAACASNIEAPADAEIDHEYPYKTYTNREIKREFAKTRAEIKQAVDSITLSVTNDEDGTSSSFVLKAGEAVLSSGNITFDGLVTFKGLKEGTTVIDGGCIQTGTILANLITAGVLQSKDGEMFKLDLDKGTFSMRGSGRFQSDDGKSYISVEGNEMVLYAKNASGQYLDKLRVGFITQPNTSGNGTLDYPYMLFGKDNSTEVGLIKKFVNGFWLGNSAPLNASGNFEGYAGAAGIFVNTKTGETYVVNGYNMQNVYTGAAIAKFK